MRPLSPAAALLLVASACGWMPELEPKTEVFDDSGALCFTSKADGSVAILVSFDTCISSSCTQVLGSSCRASESGGVITVSSHAAAEQGRTECTLDCGALTARCEAPPLAPGTYTVEYGAARAEVTLPANQAVLFPGSPVVACP